MKRLMLAISMVMHVGLAIAAQAYEPLLVVVLMVKNEEAVIIPTLEPFVQGGVEAYLIFDTGSTDKTIETVTDYFRRMNITNYIIEQEPFVNFAVSRNRALDFADYYFPHAGFYIMPDAEWYMQRVDQLLEFCASELEHNVDQDVYAISNGNDSTEFDSMRLFRANKKVRFDLERDVHECPLTTKTIMRVPRDIHFLWLPSDVGNDKTIKRTDRDISLLLQKYLKNPLDERSLFYLGQTYCVRQEYAKSLFYFRQRVQLLGFAEERFIAMYRIAQITEVLAYRNEESWAHALDYYLQAYAYRPSRAEPLIHIANYYLNNESPELAFMFAHKAVLTPYPNDSLFINKELFNFEQYRILACSAHALGHFELAHEAAQLALKARPDDERVIKVLHMCQKQTQ